MKFKWSCNLPTMKSRAKNRTDACYEFVFLYGGAHASSSPSFFRVYKVSVRSSKPLPKCYCELSTMQIHYTQRLITRHWIDDGANAPLYVLLFLRFWLAISHAIHSSSKSLFMSSLKIVCVMQASKK